MSEREPEIEYIPLPWDEPGAGRYFEPPPDRPETRTAFSPVVPKIRTCGFDAIQAQPPAFLWKPYLRAGNLNLAAGDGGSGKTTLALMIAAALADGAQPSGMPGELTVDPVHGAHTLILSFEDEPEELRFRLDGCGCRHPERVHTLIPEMIVPLMTEEAQMEALVEECGAKLIVIDPVQAFLQAGADANSLSDVRRALESLRRVCKKTGCAALLIAHLNKGTGRSAMQRVSGSMDFVNAVRSALMVFPHPRTADQRCVLHFKSNGAAAGDTAVITLSENAGAVFSGISTVSREELENTLRPPDQTETAPVKVRRLLERVCRAMPSWSMTAAELADRPENTEDLTPKTIAFSIRRAASAAGLLLTEKRERNARRYAVSAQTEMRS